MTRTTPPTSPSTSVVGPTMADRAVLWVGFPVLAAGLAWLLTRVAGWVAGLPWAPFQGPFQLVASAPEPAVTIGALLVGAVAGVVLALLAEREQITARIDATEAVLTCGDASSTVHRAEVGAVFRDGKHLVLLGHRSEELARTTGDANTGRLRAAFRAHGYPWHDDDPHRDRYRPWVDGLPDLPDGANALLSARSRALRDKKGKDAADLRTELARRHIVVRDEGSRQHWRRTDQE